MEDKFRTTKKKKNSKAFVNIPLLIRPKELPHV
jgi:hypothetical protein